MNLLKGLALTLVLISVQPENIGILFTSRSVSGMGDNAKTVSLVEFKVFGGKCRTDVYFGAAKGNSPLESSSIYDLDTGELILMSRSNKTYQRLSPADQEEVKKLAVESLSKTGALPPKRPQLVPTEERGEIEGFPVRKYTSETDSMTVEYWLTENKEHAALFLQFSQAMNAQPSAAATSLQYPDPASFPGVPIREIIRTSIAGVGVITIVSDNQLTSGVPMDQSDFKIPVDYKPQRQPN